MAVNEHAWREIVSGQRRGRVAAISRAGLRAISVPYAAAMRLRRRFYDWGLLPSHSAAVPVVSVGNLTVGGTGKTPLAAWVVRQLQQAGRSPAILTRGYKAVGGVSDEARWLRDQTGAAVIVNADRVAGARSAVAQGADACVLDDGFQHRRLRRDLDIVCVDATCPFGYGRVLPRGLLREPPAALRSADAVVITRADQVTDEALSAVRQRVADLAPRAVLAESALVPTQLASAGGQISPPASLAGRRVWAFCGLGNPQTFFRTVESLGAEIAGRSVFADHCAYAPADVALLAGEAAAVEAELLVTTAKDWVKLAPHVGSAPVWRLDVETQIVAGAEQLRERILRAAGPGQ